MASEESPEWFPATLIIPALNVQAPVVRGVDDKTMRGGVGFDPDSSAPHQIGNTVIAGHRNIWGSYFWYLPRLQKGDEVMLVTPKKKFVYTVEYSQIVQPHQTDVLETDEKSKNSHLTLYTCTKPKTECRFVVRARLKETFELTQKEFLALHKDVPAHPVNTRRPPSLPEKKTPIRLTEKK